MEKLLRHRHFREVTINISRRFSGLPRADDPKVLVLVVINDPKGTYYGGQIAAPVAKEIMENILPYLAK